MTTEVMIDLETMSLRPDAAIISIGAVKFDPNGIPGDIMLNDKMEPDRFLMNVDLADCMRYGLNVDGHTVMWWMQQSDAARVSVAADAKPLEHALASFHAWYGTMNLPTWCNHPEVDTAILKTAFLAGGYGTPPWKYNDTRDYSTVRSLFPEIEIEPPSLAHNALADAIAQATHLQKLFAALRNSQPKEK